MRKWFVNCDSGQASLKSEVVCLQEEMQRLYCFMENMSITSTGKNALGWFAPFQLWYLGQVHWNKLVSVAYISR